MFMGVRSYHDALGVASYEQAQAVLERASKTPTGRLREAKQWGYHLGMNRNHGVTWVREVGDGNIAFRLYDTDVVVWRPDNSFEIDNFGTVTTTDFARRFLPVGISLRCPREAQGVAGGDTNICYVAEPRPARGYWSDWHICRGDSPVTFRPHGEVWLPAEEDLIPMRFVQLDRKAARQISRMHHLADFDSWLSMAPRHLDIEHIEFDLDECADALRKRDFRRAAEFLPLITEPTGWGAADRIRDAALPIATRRWDAHVTMGSLARLRMALYEDAGCYRRVEATTMPQRQFELRVAEAKRLLSLDMGHDLEWGQ